MYSLSGMREKLSKESVVKHLENYYMNIKSKNLFVQLEQISFLLYNCSIEGVDRYD